jgi:DNA-binding MarR family transcriptional regulator
MHDGLSHRLLGEPTLNVGMVSGGVAPNSVPEDCTARITRRLLPGETWTSVRGRIEAAIGDLDGGWEVVLASLRRVGPPYRASPTELYTRLMRTSGAMTNRLRRLEEAGLVARVPDPADARGLLVELTPAGHRLVDELAPLHMANERELLAALSAREQRELASLLAKLLVSLESGQNSADGRQRR